MDLDFYNDFANTEPDTLQLDAIPVETGALTYLLYWCEIHDCSLEQMVGWLLRNWRDDWLEDERQRRKARGER